MDIVIQLSQRMHLICYQLRVDLTQMNIHIRTPPDRQPNTSGTVEQGLGMVQTTLSHFRSVGCNCHLNCHPHGYNCHPHAYRFHTSL